MKEQRLRTLARHAGFIGDNLNTTVIGTCQQTALNNFSELIIEECVAAILKEATWYWNKGEADSSEAVRNTARSIKEHFEK